MAEAKSIVMAACVGGMLLLSKPGLCASVGFGMSQAREARDRADVASLQTMIREATAAAPAKPTARDYMEVARLNEWLIEAAEDRNDKPAAKQAAQAGVDAARKAVALAPKSSEAHVLLGSLLGQLIAYVPMGGMRYGREATSELDTAIQLDPKNPGTYVSRAIAYFMTPSMFGGSNEKAAEFLHKALSLSPDSDEASSAYVWLAQVESKQGEKSQAARDIQSALKLDPGRIFAQQVEKQVKSAEK